MLCIITYTNTIKTKPTATNAMDLKKCDVALSAKYWKKWTTIQMNTTLTCLSKFMTNIVYFSKDPRRDS
jgi:hypothetical protein